MINQELQSQLKEAGFWEGQENEHIKIDRAPELEELIEACEKLVTGTQTSITISIYPHSKGNGFQGEDLNTTRQVYAHTSGWYNGCEGSTPEEAVAALWLKLNEKK